jgi:hypothetical protein
MEARFPDLKSRIVEFIIAAGGAGVTRTQIMQRFQTRTKDLDMLLAPLLIDRKIRQVQDEKKNALGRPAMRFYGMAVEVALTPAVKPDTPILPFGAPPARSSTCQTCGVAIPLPEVGRPYVYCSESCRRAARDGDGLPTMQDLLARAKDPRVRARVGLILVMADLCVRGFQVAIDLFNTTTRLLVHDGAGSTFLDVFVIPDSGSFTAIDEYESVALVYRDGRIVYAGRQPLIPTTPEGTANGPTA